MNTDYRLFAWNFSYFSAKVRAYCRYKAHHGALTFEEVLATQQILREHMVPATGANVVPQIEGADGRWLQDSSEIIDVLEARHPQGPVVPEGPHQRLVSFLIELLADEWMLPWAFWARWHYSLASVQPNHEAFNAQQWGRVFAPEASGRERREAARFVFREIMTIDDPGTATFGPYAGLRQLGVTTRTEAAWTASMRRMLGHLEAHFDRHDYVLGGRPTLADFALLGPLYPHLYKDPVPGFMMRTEYPLVCEWIERTNGTTEAGTRSYAETSYRMEEDRLVPCDGGELLADDAVPETLQPLISVFFEEMAPDDVVADIGAGTGYFAFPVAERVPEGRVLAVDIQPEMLAMIREKAAETGIDNVEPVLGEVTDPNLPEDAVDLIYLVDAYHEFSHPREMGEAMVRALKPGGTLILVEYRAEDPDVPIKRLHRMSEAQAKREMAALGLEWVETGDYLPQQHVLVFRKP